jgi:nucleoside-diphosphate-sugar epimerase
MVVGNGMMAQRFLSFKSDENVLIFASGVSNSKETNIENFEREKRVIFEAIAKSTTKKFVYFSTCSIYDPSEKDSLYVKHKLECEQIIKENCKDYLIFRVSNVVGKTENKNTIISYLVSKIKNKEPFQLWKNSVRNIIDIDDLLPFVSHKIQTVKGAETCIIANPFQYPVTEIVAKIEQVLNKKAIFELIDKGSIFEIPLKSEDKFILEKGVDFTIEPYLSKILNKYFINEIPDGVV